MAAGIAQLRLLDEVNPYARLDALGRQVRAAALAAAQGQGPPAPELRRRGSMFSLFFTRDTRCRDMRQRRSPSDAKLFGRFFHACLAGGVYLPASAYEAWFLSTAHEGPSHGPGLRSHHRSHLLPFKSPLAFSPSVHAVIRGHHVHPASRHVLRVLRGGCGHLSAQPRQCPGRSPLADDLHARRQGQGLDRLQGPDARAVHRAK